MEQVEMNNMYINIDVNESSEKCTEKTLRQEKNCDTVTVLYVAFHFKHATSIDEFHRMRSCM